MSHKRLNHLLILKNIHKERTDKFDPKDSFNDFVTGSQHRAWFFFSVLICDFAMTVHCLNCVMNRNS